jgi:HD-GYP domain-containing protein (c-di-GMP phosphodiesterase class II)
MSGEGYPDGLSGEQISLEARILAVADVYDALISERPYRPGMKKGEAIQLIKQETGSHFDQNVVAAFLAIVGRSGTDGKKSASNVELVDMEVLEIIGHKSKKVST